MTLALAALTGIAAVVSYLADAPGLVLVTLGLLAATMISAVARLTGDPLVVRHHGHRR